MSSSKQPKSANAKKAFIFTTDALLAIFVSAVLLSGLLAILSKISPEKYSPSARSALAAMEKTGALSSNMDSPGALLKYAPKNTCAYIKIWSGNALVSSAGGSCECGDMSVARRSFVVLAEGSAKSYTAEMGVCTR